MDDACREYCIPFALTLAVSLASCGAAADLTGWNRTAHGNQLGY